MLTIRLFSVITISVLMVWRFFLPEYQLCCFRLGRIFVWILKGRKIDGDIFRLSAIEQY